MLKFTIEEGSFTISGDKTSLDDAEHGLFLRLEMGFDDAKNGFVYKGEITGKLIFDIYQYFREYDTKITLDDKCEKLIGPELQKQEDFSERIERGIKAKKNISISAEIRKGVSLEPYQLRSVNHAIEAQNSANFSVPGSGKTWMAYAAFLELKKRKIVDKILVIGPLSAFRPWEFEYKQIFGKPPKSYRIKSHKIDRLLAYLDENEIFLVSYKTAANYQEYLIHALKQEKFLLICDESHYIKNPSSERTTAALEIAPYATCRMILTGTPMPQGPEDLWGQFTFLLPRQELLGSFAEYREKIEIEGFAEVKKIFEPIYTRVGLDELNLPKQIFQRPTVEMAPLQRDIYNSIARTIIKNHKIDWREESELDQWRTNMVVYLLEAAVDPTLLTKEPNIQEEILDYKGMSFPDLIRNYQKIGEMPGKISKVLEEVPKVVDGGQKVVVWSWLVRNLHRLQKELKKNGYDSIMVTGKVPQDEEADPNDNREKRIEEFKNSDIDILLANPASCAESISLHKHCQNAIYLDRNFHGAQWMQSLSRIHRIGMENKNPKYMVILSEDSIDEDVDARLDFKYQNMLRFLNEDFSPLNLDLDESVFGLEVKDDFQHVLNHLMKGKI